MPTATELFRLVHAGHDVIQVAQVFPPPGAEAPLICLTCFEEQHPEPAPNWSAS